MICWVVTGPVGAGKSSFSKALARRGAVIVDGDVIGHEVLKDQRVIDDLVKSFSQDILLDGAIDRAQLGKVVFNNPMALEKLNSITHPQICTLAREKIAALEKENRHSLAVFEAAVYFLFSSPPVCDLIISIIADEATRSARLVAKRGLSLKEAEARLKSQLSLGKQWETADVLVHNNGSMEELDNRAHQMMVEYGIIAGGHDPRRESF